MLRSNTSDQIWTTTEQLYTLEYTMLHSQNECFEEYELWEYGIRCALFDEEHHLVSESEVEHISKEETKVTDMIQLLLKYKVFPVHLYDVVSDELMKSLDCCY